MQFSDDEIGARCQQVYADCEVKLMLSMAEFTVSLERAQRAFERLAPAMTAAMEQGVALLSHDERVLFDSLVACGTPELDALADVVDLRAE